MSVLFSPLTLRSVTCRNRVFVSPMCQYSARDGLANEWHLVHLGSRAVGGAGLVVVEATAVTPEGRISPADVGLWSTRTPRRSRPVAAFLARARAPWRRIQLAHAGRKAGTAVPVAGRRAAAVRSRAAGRRWRRARCRSPPVTPCRAR